MISPTQIKALLRTHPFNSKTFPFWSIINISNL
uniref:Uncharacterized protein n=1 Tax=Rhizophora mucronata TaxID=61149 RepID=A0A2P2L9N1_RHIMU